MTLPVQLGATATAYSILDFAGQPDKPKDDFKNTKGQIYADFLLRGAGGTPKTTSAPPPHKTRVPLDFQKTIERTIETIDYCFRNNTYCLPPPKLFSSRKPEM